MLRQVCMQQVHKTMMELPAARPTALLSLLAMFTSALQVQMPAQTASLVLAQVTRLMTG
jgi:hypothetical protein